jgi:hypothetical protein
VIDIGETALDEDTFDEYLTEIKEHYTADKVKNRGLLEVVDVNRSSTFRAVSSLG